MKKILMLVLLMSYANAQMVITKEVIADSMLDGVTGVFKEITGQNDEANEKNCQIEYKRLYETHSKQLIVAQQENIQLKRIVRANSIPYVEVTMDHLKIRRNTTCTIEYWDYLKSSSHDIGQLTKENRQIKVILSKRNINYTPLLKRKTLVYDDAPANQSERDSAKEELKRQMAF